MSLKKVEQLKGDRGFRLPDLIIYGAIAVLVAVLIVVFFVARPTGELRGISVQVANTPVFVYDFEGKTFQSLKTEGYPFAEAEEDGGSVVVTVHCSESGYNVINIDKQNRVVRVTDSDCRRGDCQYTALSPLEITAQGSKPIICMPHGLVISPLDSVSDYDGPVIV